MRRSLFMLASLLLLSACLVQSQIQGRYVEDQSYCRDSAESSIGKYEKPSTGVKERNAQLVTLFANCMNKRGWQVAKPKRVTTAGPHGPLDPYPSSIKAPATQGAAGQQPVRTQSTPLSPSGGMPPLNPPVSTYQPGRNYYAPSSGYGTGAGRNF